MTYEQEEIASLRFIIKRMEVEKHNLREALKDVMSWVNSWHPHFTKDEEWADTASKVDAALSSTKS